MQPQSLINRLVPILIEDAELLVVNKPAGVDAGGRRDDESTGLTELLVEVRGRRETLVPVNRLSRFESGVLLLAKSQAIAEEVRKAFKANKAQQSYLAIVEGRMNKPSITVGGSHGASRGRKKPPSRTTAKATRGKPPRASASAAIESATTTISRMRQVDGGSLVRCQTSVSTTHALRAQLRAAGLRLRGDQRGGPTRRSVTVEQTMLHLHEVSIPLPARKPRFTVKAPLGRDGEPQDAGGFPIERALRAGLVRRLPCFQDATTDCYRLLSGAAESLDGLSVERFGDVVFLQVLSDRPDIVQSLKNAAAFYRNVLGVRAVYAKWFVKDRKAVDRELLEGMHSAAPLLGAPMPPQIEARENGLLFAVRPYDGFSVGLFLDQRDNRERIRDNSRGRDVLNLFAYTCGFSVAAAVGGADKTTSVDLSPKHLEWGKVNFQLNHVDPANHEFVAADALDYLGRAKTHERLFDVIVVDAPTFAHGRKSGRSFSIVEDLPALLKACVGRLRPSGLLMVSTNHRRTSHRVLRERVRQACGKREVASLDCPPLPIDFAVDPDHAKTVFARIT